MEIAFLTFVESACDDLKDGLGKFNNPMLTSLRTATHGSNVEEGSYVLQSPGAQKSRILYNFDGTLCNAQNSGVRLRHRTTASEMRFASIKLSGMITGGSSVLPLLKV